MSNVFISYSSKDRKFAERIAKGLEQWGARVFYDREIVPGEDWSSRLTTEIERANYIIVLLSPAYLKSNWAQRELEAAVLAESEGRARIIPVLVQETRVPVFLRDRQYVDLSKDYKAGLDRIKKALRRKPELPERARILKKYRIANLFSYFTSLIAAAVGALSAFGTTLVATKPYTLLIAVAAVGTLTGLVATILFYRRIKPVGPLEIVTRGVERSYIEALEVSGLSPLHVGEGSHE